MTAVIEHRYEPRGSARTVMECRDPEVLVSGPAGTGKSRACIEKLHMMCLLTPGLRVLMVRKTLVSLTGSGLVTYQKFVAAESIAAGHVKWFGGSAREPAQWKYSNKSVIVVGGLDKPVKIMSTEYDVIYVQEATELTTDDWESCTTRLRGGTVSFQQLLADCNPDKATHWLKLRCDDGLTTMLESRHWENPVYYHADGTPTAAGAAYVEGVLKNLTGVRKARLCDGLWATAEGVIYEEWDATVHLIGRFAIPDSWTRWWSVDFGYTHPFVCQWWAEDPDGRLYLYRELQHTGRLVEAHAADILRAVTRVTGKVKETAGPGASGDDILADIRSGARVWTEPKPRAIVCDHDAEGRGTLAKHVGMSTTAAHKAVTEGIQAVQARLRPAGDGRPRLFVMRESLIRRDPELVNARKPTCLAEEIPGYVWDTGAGRKLKEQPLKELDDACDPMRYVVAERDLGARPRVRFMGR